MHLFPVWLPLREDALLTALHAILTRTAQSDRLENWSVAASV